MASHSMNESQGVVQGLHKGSFHRPYGSSVDLSVLNGGSSSDDSTIGPNMSSRAVPQHSLPSLTSSVSYGNLLNAPNPESPTRFLWIGNLTLKATRPQLCAVFEKFGLLEDLVSFPGRIYAFVTYQNVESAVKCHQALQGIVLSDITADSGMVIKYRPERKASMHSSESNSASASQSNDAEVEPSPRIWLGNIAPTATAANLQSVLGRFGRLVDAAVFPARIGPLGYAFVKFERIEDAINAYNTLNNAVVPALSGTKQVKMRYKPVSEGAPPRDTTLDALQASIPSRHIWIGNVTQKPSEDALIRIFSRYGSIESARVFSAKSYAFVNFFDVASAIEAITKLDGVSVPVLTGLKPLVMRYQHDSSSTSRSTGSEGQSTLNSKMLDLLNRSRTVPNVSSVADSHQTRLATPSESDMSMSDVSMTSTDPSKLSAILQSLTALNPGMVTNFGANTPSGMGGMNGLNGMGVDMNGMHGMHGMHGMNGGTSGGLGIIGGFNGHHGLNSTQSSLLWPGAPLQPEMTPQQQSQHSQSHALHRDGSHSSFSPWI
jgi:RNA recognition motif-containing protein